MNKEFPTNYELVKEAAHEEIITIAHALRLLDTLYKPTKEINDLATELKSHYHQYLANIAKNL